MELEEMYELNKKATKALFNEIKKVKGIELLEYNEGIKFKHNGHTFVFTAEFEE